MTTNAQFHGEAEEELRDAVRYYEHQQPGLGEKFAIQIREEVALAVEEPMNGSPFEEGTRRRSLGRFPYSIIYLPDRFPIMIVAVMHQRRRPGYWLDRLRTIDED